MHTTVCPPPLVSAELFSTGNQLSVELGFADAATKTDITAVCRELKQLKEEVGHAPMKNFESVSEKLSKQLEQIKVELGQAPHSVSDKLMARR